MRMTLGKKLYGVVGGLVVVMTILTVLAFLSLSFLAKYYHENNETDGAQMIEAMHAQVELGNAIHDFKDYLLRRDEKYIADFRTAVKKMKEHVDIYDRLGDSNEKGKAAKFRELIVPYEQSMDKLVSVCRAGTDIGTADKEIKGVDRPMYALLSTMIDESKGNFMARDNDLDSKGAVIRLIQVIMAVLSISVSLVAATAVMRKVLRSLKSVKGVAEKACEGDLCKDVPVDSNDEIGEMSGSINSMMGNLRKIGGQIKGMTNLLADSSDKLSSETDDLSRVAREQVSQIDQSVTAVTEISQTMTDVANNAAAASETSRNASEIANQGRLKVDGTAEGMGQIADMVRKSADTIQELGASSREIGNIVHTINDIAEQTNLLALNAAIEAARAGEQGRGFAVVADEVRKLAERTGKATFEISDMIRKIQADTEKSVGSMQSGIAEVENGLKLVAESKAALDQIVESSDNSNDMVQRIAVAIEQQSSAIEEVSTTLESIANNTKGTEATAEKIRVSAQELSKMAFELNGSADWFKLEERDLKR